MIYSNITHLRKGINIDTVQYLTVFEFFYLNTTNHTL